jgi:hypothetical protein
MNDDLFAGWGIGIICGIILTGIIGFLMTGWKLDATLVQTLNQTYPCPKDNFKLEANKEWYTCVDNSWRLVK